MKIGEPELTVFWWNVFLSTALIC